jgi:hypothetical protein
VRDTDELNRVLDKVWDFVRQAHNRHVLARHVIRCQFLPAFTPNQHLSEKFLAERNTARAELVRVSSRAGAGFIVVVWPDGLARAACPLIEEGAAAVERSWRRHRRAPVGACCLSPVRLPFRARLTHTAWSWRLPLPAGWDWPGGCSFVGDGDERDVDLPCPVSRHAATARRAWPK